MNLFEMSLLANDVNHHRIKTHNLRSSAPSAGHFFITKNISGLNNKRAAPASGRSSNIAETKIIFMFRKFLVVPVLFFILIYTSCSKDSGSSQVQPRTDTTVTPTPPPGTPSAAVIYDNDNILLGNPTNATLADDNNYLMVKSAYDLSYNRSRGTSNWVSWHLYSADLGSISRTDDFEPDPTLPFSWYAITSSSYSNTGFDRGHSCPSGDRTSTAIANQNTFYMTNIIPQAPKLNQGAWNDFENYTRSLVQSGDEEYIIMGSYGEGGTGTNGYVTTIDNGNVVVPATIWKVVVVIANGNNDTSRITSTTRVIAVQMKNDNSLGSVDWKAYRTNVDAIETATGLDLLSRLPVSVQSAIEAKVDTQ